jgi:hypothetical protein
MDPGLVRTAMTERQLESDQGQKYLTDIPPLFERGIDVPPTLAARLSVEIGLGRFDRMAGRMLMAARGDINLDEDAVDKIVASDLRASASTECRRNDPTCRSRRPHSARRVLLTGLRADKCARSRSLDRAEAMTPQELR